jgi:hypothetical protein
MRVLIVVAFIGLLFIMLGQGVEAKSRISSFAKKAFRKTVHAASEKKDTAETESDWGMLPSWNTFTKSMGVEKIVQKQKRAAEENRKKAHRLYVRTGAQLRLDQMQDK